MSAMLSCWSCKTRMIDFFCIPEDQCKATNNGRMYLYDGENDAPAVLLESPTESRPILVENPSGLSYVFRPVDKVVYGPQDPKRGDVFFHTTDKLQLYFAEVKLWHVSGWFKEGVHQLKSVVMDFIGAHPEVYGSSLLRRAFLCNPYHPRFAYSHANEIRDFRRETRFVLHPEGRVQIG